VEQLALELLRRAEQLDAGDGAARHLADWQQEHPDWADQVSLDRSAYDNAQELVHYAQRLRRGVDTLEGKIATAQAELARIERGAPAGARKRKAADPLASASKRLERDGIKYLRFLSSDGMHIVCGVSDRSNDGLLRAFGSSRHLWLHARDFSGSHVIVLSGGQDVPRRTLEEAAVVAAWHSKGRRDTDVDVSYLPLKHLRRVKGGKPGHVLKTQENVISVRPARFEAIRDRLHYSGR
jgi:predicted ribosome quality control (RQC) complex YloA/Tae2 family protein